MHCNLFAHLCFIISKQKLHNFVSSGFLTLISINVKCHKNNEYQLSLVSSLLEDYLNIFFFVCNKLLSTDFSQKRLETIFKDV